MKNRREFLIGSACVVLSPLVPTYGEAAAFAPQKEAALSFITERVKASFARYVLFDEENAIPTQWSGLYRIWKDGGTLQEMLQRELEVMFADDEFKKMKESRGSIVDETGLPWLPLEYKLFSHFPVLPDACDRDLFLAYAQLAPDELL